MKKSMTRRMWNYLRARGEYCYQTKHLGFSQELPPRTRRILGLGGVVDNVSGTTSAHAENTYFFLSAAILRGNYLRARGEYPFDWAIGRTPWELPPRTRRIRTPFVPPDSIFGTTSAHAENTHSRPHQVGLPRNYLRARGEYPK